MVFALFISFVVLLRLGELLLSKKNEKWLRQNNAVEYGRKHYPFIVALHVLFISSLILEYSKQPTASPSSFWIVCYFSLITFKIWVVLSLGKFWNTKIYRVPNIPLIKKGPYRYFKHPNYAVVIAEIAVIPIAFQLYYTAVIFTLLNLVMLFIRIKEENKVLDVYNQVVLT